eukprot:CAMPEP_0202693794 /NCGR_PEP_ID=MMETSP1385-20130828/7822_1 /ASSEMBLY_ACC=CAM_ASM_000861 /TAXON_ID=933848 /ORGANISM="Elphidium margaritaceum" /LENGTH=530 /DNA_ID=CAMNT_0049349525 /DNA_START=87 /DNA_END=1679 /DNA_ORIENTATION=+
MNGRKEKLCQWTTQYISDIELLYGVDTKHGSHPLQTTLSKIERTCTQFIDRFYEDLVLWVRTKPNTSVLNISKINAQYQQLYATDSEFWLRCFQIVYKLTDDLCGDTDNATSLKQLVLLRGTLMLFKYKTKQNTHSGFYPVFRCKTFVESVALHCEMDQRHPTLHVAAWVQKRFEMAKKAKNKAGAGKRAIEGGCKLFVRNFVQWLEIEYVKHYQQVQQTQMSPQIREQLQNELGSAPKIVVCGLLRESQKSMNAKLDELKLFFSGAATAGSENSTVSSECDAKCEADNVAIASSTASTTYDGDQHLSLSTDLMHGNQDNMEMSDFDQFDTASSLEWTQWSFMPNVGGGGGGAIAAETGLGSSTVTAPSATAPAPEAAYVSTPPQYDAPNQDAYAEAAVAGVADRNRRDLEALRNENQSLWNENHSLRNENAELRRERQEMVQYYRERYDMIADCLHNMSRYLEANRTSFFNAPPQREFQRTPIFHGSARVNYHVQQSYDHQRRLTRRQYIDQQHAQLQQMNNMPNMPQL